MNKPLLIVQTKTGFAVIAVEPSAMPPFDPLETHCVADLEHYSRTNTVLELVKDHFKEAPDATAA